MNLRRILTAATLAVMTTGLASAGSVFYTATSGTQTTDYNYSLVLPEFNGSLGTLTSVTIYLFGTETVSALNLTNNAAINETFTLIASSMLSNTGNTANAADKFATETLQQFNSGSITLGPNATKPACPVGTPSANCGKVAYTPPNITVTNTTGGCCGTTGTGLGGTTGVVLSSANLASYVGTALSTFTLTGGTLAGTTFSGGGGNIQLDQTTTVNLTVEVDYAYTAFSTPEPASFLLAGPALLGLAFVRRKK